MRGYSGIMATTDTNNVQLNGNGTKVHLKAPKHTLWTPTSSGTATPEPLWYLRVSVLKDQEGRGDCPSRRFAFKSLHHLTHATNQLDATFGSTLEVRKCGVEKPDAMGGRVNDGRSENITIEYDTEAKGTLPWQDFLAKLRALEDEWDHESVIDVLWKRDEDQWE